MAHRTREQFRRERNLYAIASQDYAAAGDNYRSLICSLAWEMLCAAETGSFCGYAKFADDFVRRSYSQELWIEPGPPPRTVT